MDLTATNGSGGISPESAAEKLAGEGVAGASSSDDVYDITIIGAGPTGLFGAFYAGMRKMKTKIIDALPEPGGQLSALYPEKYIYDVPGFPKILARDLVAQLVEQAMAWGPTLCLGERVLQLDKENGNWVLTTDKARHVTRTIVIAAGVGAFSPNRLNVPGLEEFENRGLYYFVKDKSIFAGRDLLIVGGGDSAVDWALNLYGVANSVTLIHRRPEFRAHESSVAELMSLPIDILTPYEIRSIKGGRRVEEVTIFNNQTQEERTIGVHAVLVNAGFKADIGPIREWGLSLEKRGVLVNNKMETNLEGVFAAGDIAAEEVKMNLITTGFGQAAMAVNVAKRYIDPKAPIFPGHSSEKLNG